MSMITVEKMRETLSKEAEKLVNGNSTPASCHALANIAGKIIYSVKMELEYNKMLGAHPKINFFDEVMNKMPKQIENK